MCPSQKVQTLVKMCNILVIFSTKTFYSISIRFLSPFRLPQGHPWNGFWNNFSGNFFWVVVFTFLNSVNPIPIRGGLIMPTQLLLAHLIWRPNGFTEWSQIWCIWRFRLYVYLSIKNSAFQFNSIITFHFTFYATKVHKTYFISEPINVLNSN